MHHPKIGEKVGEMNKHKATKEWAEQEQSGVKNANQNILDELDQTNKEYLTKFGYIFIVCASGKSASEMLELLKLRIDNKPDYEIKIAAAEQNKITNLRIDKLFI